MIAGILLSIVAGLLANELCEFSPWCARKLVRWSAFRRYTDPSRAEVGAEELTAVINDLPGNLFKLITAVSFAAAAVVVSSRRAVGRWRCTLLFISAHDVFVMNGLIVALKTARLAALRCDRNRVLDDDLVAALNCALNPDRAWDLDLARDLEHARALALALAATPRLQSEPRPHRNLKPARARALARDLGQARSLALAHARVSGYLREHEWPDGVAPGA